MLNDSRLDAIKDLDTYVYEQCRNRCFCQFLNPSIVQRHSSLLMQSSFHQGENELGTQAQHVLLDPRSLSSCSYPRASNSSHDLMMQYNVQVGGTQHS